MNLEQFASRGLKAQAAVDKLLSPAQPVGVSPGTRAGEHATTRPRSCSLQVQILSSTDTAWLKQIMNSQDYTIGIRTAAQRRLAKLFRKKP